MSVLKPPANVVIALGSIARHAEELFSDKGHAVDRTAILTLLSVPDLQDWMAEADKLALLPVKR